MRGSSCWGSWSSWPWCSGFPLFNAGWGVDDISYVLTLLVLVPLVGSVAVWVAGITQRTAKWIALGFSLVETGLTTLLLVGFVEPAWAFAFGAPTFFVDGVRHDGPWDEENLVAAIERALREKGAAGRR